MTPAEVAAFIRSELPRRPAPGAPELQLHLAGPRSGLHRLAEADPTFGTPYWAYAWAGGLALARRLLDSPGLLEGRSVLDLGCGSGLVALAAARAGAARVQAVDVDSYACAAARVNAEAAGAAVDVRCADALAEVPPADVDLVLAGDLFYAADAAGRAAACLDRCLAAGLEVWVGDRGRAHLPRARLRRLSEHEVRDAGEAGPVAAAVYAWVGP